MIHRIALQTANGDGLVFGTQYACPFAKLLHGTDAGACGAEKVCIQYRAGRANQVIGGDLLDEAWDVDVGGARMGAGRVVAKQAAISFDDGLMRGERWNVFRQRLPGGSSLLQERLL